MAFLWVQAFAQIDSTPLVDGVGVQEHLGEWLDLELEFSDQNGKAVQLKDYFQAGRPVIIAPVYYTCPRMCTLVLNGVAQMIRDVDMQLGDDYVVLNISFDATNTPAMAKAKAATYYDSVKPKQADGHWQFLTGSQEAIDQVMNQIGFKYKWINDAYSHASIITFLGDDGKITRYLYGVQYPSRDARLALVEASEGKVGTTLDRFLIFCFHYDPLAGKYTFMATNIMRVGGVLTILALSILGYFLFKKPLHKQRMELNG